ncbi:MAG: NirD/YgiW/YdeI family stress tolerance protein, partial [Woeseiaceae bacterium]
QSGGFVGPDDRPLVGAAGIAKLKDDSRVRLVGFVVKSLGDEKYEFSDDSGTVVVEIDDEDWNGIEVSPGLRVEIAGEVDKDWRDVEVEVDNIRIAD